MELQILNASLNSRETFDLFARHLNPKKWSREFQILFDYIHDYYRRDRDAKLVDRDVLENILQENLQNNKHVDKFLGFLRQAYDTEGSSANVLEAVLVAKRNELALSLAEAIVNNKKHDELLDQYNEVLSRESLEAVDDHIETYTADDIDEILADRVARKGVIKIYPKALYERLDGGLEGSDHMIIIARPEMGKTALILTMACGAARDGHRVLIFNNEEKIARLYVRAIACITGMSIFDIRNDPTTARNIAMERGFGNLVFKSMSPGSPEVIANELGKYPDTKIFIVDQLRNLLVKADSKTNQLEAAAQSVRNIAKARNIIAISVTQAGDSASDKSILNMGDVDNSNTGIPGACDVLLGVGANEAQKAEGIRIFTPIKNKASGDHEPFPTRLNPLISKYISL